MHPAERLRFVARSSGAPQSALVEEAAAGLASFIADPGALVMACRRVLARQPTSAPLVWLAAHVLASPEPYVAARECVDRIGIDRTDHHLARWLPPESTVCVLGWPDLVAGTLVRRPDLRVLVVDAGGEGTGLARWLDQQEIRAEDVPFANLGSAVAEAKVVLVEASAIGPTHAVAVAGSFPAAATARVQEETEVVLVGGVGRNLPARMFDGLRRRVDDANSPWPADDEFVPLSLFESLAQDEGVDDMATGVRRVDCPVVAELFGGNDGVAI